MGKNKITSQSIFPEKDRLVIGDDFVLLNGTELSKVETDTLVLTLLRYHRALQVSEESKGVILKKSKLKKENKFVVSTLNELRGSVLSICQVTNRDYDYNMSYKYIAPNSIPETNFEMHLNNLATLVNVNPRLFGNSDKDRLFNLYEDWLESKRMQLKDAPIRSVKAEVLNRFKPYIPYTASLDPADWHASIGSEIKEDSK